MTTVRIRLDGTPKHLNEQVWVKKRTCKRVGIKCRTLTCHIEWKCSKCGYPLYSDHDSYCSECGAKVVG